MEAMMFVKPVEGRRCKDPVTCELLPEAGRNVERNSYWVKRVAKGDCVEIKDSKSKAPKEEKAAEPKEEKAAAPKEEKAEKPAEIKAPVVVKKKTKTGGRR